MQRRQVVLSWSGGKDSALALDALRREGEYDVVGLLTSITRDYDRISVHGVRRSLLRAQAESVGLPLTEITLEKIAPTSRTKRRSARHCKLSKKSGPRCATLLSEISFSKT